MSDNSNNAIYFFMGAHYGLPLLILCLAALGILLLFGLVLFLTSLR